MEGVWGGEGLGSKHIPGCTCRICHISRRRTPWRPSEPSCVLSIRTDLQQQEVRLYSLRLLIKVIHTKRLHLRDWCLSIDHWT